ncbi:MAG: CvpA family protein [Bacteroidota bacterium]|nr:CvpA family protein [Bacteroidota bacterium]
MHYTFDINLDFSIFGVIIFGILVWGGYRGYMKGGIIMGLSLFALIAGVVLSAVLTRVTYSYFWQQGSEVPDVFGSVVLGLTFIAGIWFSNFILKAVHTRVRDTDSDKTNNIFGATLGVAKFFIIVGIYSTVILNLDYNGNYLPEKDKKSYLLNTSSWVMTRTVKLLRMDYHRPPPEEPDDTAPSQNNNTNNKQINFKKNKNNNSNNQNTNNKDKNQDDDLVSEVK